jgi:hypothetical protein
VERQRPWLEQLQEERLVRQLALLLALLARRLEPQLVLWLEL